MAQYQFSTVVVITVEHDTEPNMDSVVEAVQKAVSVDLATEESENITDTGAEITAIEIDWESLRLR